MVTLWQFDIGALGDCCHRQESNKWFSPGVRQVGRCDRNVLRSDKDHIYTCQPAYKAHEQPLKTSTGLLDKLKSMVFKVDVAMFQP